jgi:hypothetical protein
MCGGSGRQQVEVSPPPSPPPPPQQKAQQPASSGGASQASPDNLTDFARGVATLGGFGVGGYAAYTYDQTGATDVHPLVVGAVIGLIALGVLHSAPIQALIKGIVILIQILLSIAIFIAIILGVIYLVSQNNA